MVKMRHRNEPQNEVAEFELKGVDEGEAKANHFTMNTKTSATANSAQYQSQIPGCNISLPEGKTHTGSAENLK